MNDTIEAAIKVLGVACSRATTAHEAMQYAQAALNLAHTAQVLKSLKQ